MKAKTIKPFGNKRFKDFINAKKLKKSARRNYKIQYKKTKKIVDKFKIDTKTKINICINNNKNQIYLI